MSEGSPPPPARRYPRSAQGLIASLVVTVVLVVIVGLALRADNGGVEGGPDSVDYLEAVDAARDAELSVVYPPALPAGWRATSVDFDPGPRPAWSIGTLTADGTFAGLRQQKGDLDDLVQTYVDESPEQGEDVTVDSSLAPVWSTWSDSGGDHAYGALVDVDGEQESVLVYGSASTTDLRTLLESLRVD